MTELATNLTVAEADYLAQCEETISHGLQTFIEVGTALAMIRDNRLYRAEHPTFEAYCAERWGFTDRRARQLIDAAAIGTMVPVESERQARELARVPEEQRAEVWRETVEATGGKPTAAAIRDTFERTQSPAVRSEPAPEASTSAGAGPQSPARQDSVTTGVPAIARPDGPGNNHPRPTGEADAPLAAAVAAAASEAPAGVGAPAGAGDSNPDSRPGEAHARPGQQPTDPRATGEAGTVFRGTVPAGDPHADGDARRDAELDAAMAGTVQRFRTNFATARVRAGEITTFDPDRICEVYAGNWDREVGDLLDLLDEWSARVKEARRARQRAGLRLVGGGR